MNRTKGGHSHDRQARIYTFSISLGILGAFFSEVSIIIPVDERSEAGMQGCDKFPLPTLWRISLGMGFGREEKVMFR